MPFFKIIPALLLASVIELLLFARCREPRDQIPESVALTLQLAGKNRAQLVNVIHYFEKDKDKRKLQAVYYLLANMADQFHYSGNGIHTYRLVFGRMDSLLESGHGVFDHSWDSIQKIYPPPGRETVNLTRDAETVTASLLISHVNAAFKAWNYPWAKQLSFDDFCKYILPYKLGNEEPEAWMPEIQKEYKWVIDSLKSEANPLRACALINNKLKNWFYPNARFECKWDVTYNDLKTIRTGKCIHATQITTYIMRAMGLPVVMDSAPHWANKNMGHSWNAIMLNNKAHFFAGAESNPGETKIEFTKAALLRRKRGKIYRQVFAIQMNSLGAITDSRNIPPFLQNRHILDVTNEYVPVSSATIKLNGNNSNSDYAYLCVFSDRDWKVLDWAKPGWFNKVTFNNLERGICYAIMYYEDNRLTPASDPFIIDQKGELTRIIPDDKENERLVLRKKYPEDESNYIFKGENYELFYWLNGWKSLGRTLASSDSLEYRNVPKNALLLLHNSDKGKQERIFRYIDNQQEWW